LRKAINHISKHFAYAAVTVVLLVAFGTNARSQSTVAANQVKAVFLYNFTQFVSWPPQALHTGRFVIGVLGNDPFGANLDAVVAGEKVGSLPIVVQRFKDISEVQNCHMLYVQKGSTKEIFNALKGKSILTVGDEDDFTKDGGIIRFLFEKNKIRLQINVSAAKAANLSISSKLLRLAEVINQ
jgi:hypothetical protein